MAGPAAPIVWGLARFAPVLLRIPQVAKAVKTAGQAAGKASKARSAAKPTVKKPAAKKTPVEQVKGKPAPMKRRKPLGPKDVLTRGERQTIAQEKVARTQRAASEFNKRTADSARAAKGAKVRGMQKSPGKPPRAISKATKERTPTTQWANKTARGFGIGVAAGGLYAAGGVGTRPSSSSAGRLTGRPQGTLAKPATTTPSPNLGTPPPAPSGKKDKKDKPKPTPPGGTSGGTTRAGGGAVRPSGAAKTKVKKPAQKPAKAMPTVSQSRTMWVKKGDIVSGQEVQRGYLAQYGKAEKRVSAKVKIVADTESGKKAGETYKYKMGRATGKVKKRK